MWKNISFKDSSNFKARYNTLLCYISTDTLKFPVKGICNSLHQRINSQVLLMSTLTDRNFH
uniref:Uncharacterized protein n=1 Tax=Anguilla anguilla TaxID=7936 RepID=A0A0E9WN53_ANGAN